MLRIFQLKHLYSLHPYLQQNLNRLKLASLTAAQQQVLALSSNKHHHLLINQPTGSGKTLCYLIPLLNNILTNNRIEGKPWGGLILTLTKELGIQIYRQVRLLDPENRIKISRIGSISHFSGIVEKLNKKTQTSANLDELVRENVVNTVNWSNWDIVVSTPHALLHAVNKQQNLLRPSTVIIDEADMLLAIDENVAAVTKNLMKKYFKKSEKVQYILAASSFPKKMMGMEYMTALNSLFPKIQTVESERKHRLPTTLKVQFIDTAKFENETKDDVLLKILNSALSTPSKPRIMIFCNSAKTVQNLSSFLTTKNIKNDTLTADRSTQLRAQILSTFQRKQIDILVSTNLASRGFDLDVDIVIEYNMATNVVDYINRAGRTARFGKKGALISFIEEENRMLFGIIKEKLEKNQPMDEAFSRKRSLSKTNKKYEDESDDDTL